jgi:hypothetical protein
MASRPYDHSFTASIHYESKAYGGVELILEYRDELRAGQLGFDSRQGQKIFRYSTESRLALRPTQTLT